VNDPLCFPWAVWRAVWLLGRSVACFCPIHCWLGLGLGAGKNSHLGVVGLKSLWWCLFLCGVGGLVIPWRSVLVWFFAVGWDPWDPLAWVFLGGYGGVGDPLGRLSLDLCVFCAGVSWVLVIHCENLL